MLQLTTDKIVAAFRGMHVLPAKHSYVSVTDGRTDGQTDGQTDRQQTKWSLCVAMLHRRHKKLDAPKSSSWEYKNKQTLLFIRVAMCVVFPAWWGTHVQYYLPCLRCQHRGAEDGRKVLGEDQVRTNTAEARGIVQWFRHQYTHSTEIQILHLTPLRLWVSYSGSVISTPTPL